MRLILISLVGILFIQSDKPPAYLLIGYRDAKPVFNEIRSNKIFALGENNVVLNLPIDTEGERAEFINDGGLVTVSKDKRNVTITLINGSKSLIKSKAEVGALSMDDDCKYLALMSNDSISVLKGSALVNKFKGGFPQIIGNCIYFISYENKRHALVDLYKRSLDDEGARELVLADIFEPGILVFDAGKYVACSTPYHGRARYCVYNTDIGTYRVFEDSIIREREPVYFPNTKSLYYYSQRQLKVEDKVDYD